MVNSCVCHTQQLNITFHTFNDSEFQQKWLKDNQDDFNEESKETTHNTYIYAQRPNLRCSA